MFFFFVIFLFWKINLIMNKTLKYSPSYNDDLCKTCKVCQELDVCIFIIMFLTAIILPAYTSSGAAWLKMFSSIYCSPGLKEHSNLILWNSVSVFYDWDDFFILKSYHSYFNTILCLPYPWPLLYAMFPRLVRSCLSIVAFLIQSFPCIL